MIALAIPAAIMDSKLKKYIDEIGLIVAKLEVRVTDLENQNKELKTVIEKDVHEHVRKLVSQIQTLETEIKSLKG
ncbi:MAG: hypothetical protein JSV56_10325 [Methanomassiliicoccales archaeon]|nr:MAG: hypothetical protein JSV56_10325 [Methanomassiliicoccales archaeon]